MLFVNKFERLSVFLKHIKFFATLNFSFFAVSNTNRRRGPLTKCCLCERTTHSRLRQRDSRINDGKRK